MNSDDKISRAVWTLILLGASMVIAVILAGSWIVWQTLQALGY